MSARDSSRGSTGSFGGFFNLFRRAAPPLKPEDRIPVPTWIGTWNMGNSAPPTASVLRQWIPLDEFDMYVFGVQEATFSLSSGAPGPSKSASLWNRSLKEVFAESSGKKDEQYVELKTASLLNIRISIWVRKRLRSSISDIQVKTLATGRLNFANKGAVAIAMEILSTPVCFVNTHLAAHQEAVKERNADYRAIVAGLHFGKAKLDLLFAFDVLVWLGDLNYRIDVAHDEAMAASRRGTVMELLQHDQLAKQRDREIPEAFTGFHEEEVTFPPTYKMIRSGLYEFEQDKQRVPSWTDRVMWRAAPGAVVHPHIMPGGNSAYVTCKQMPSSDHKPVSLGIDLYAQPKFNSRQSENVAVLTISGLSAHVVSRDSNGFSDPYIVLQSRLFPDVRSSVVWRNLSPVWPDVIEIEIDAVHTNAQWLARHVVVLSVWDKDRLKADDRLGTASLHLGVLGRSDHHFEQPLLLRGVPAVGKDGPCTISGTASLAIVPKKSRK